MKAGRGFREKAIGRDTNITAHRHADFVFKPLLDFIPRLYHPLLAQGRTLSRLMEVDDTFIDTFHRDVRRIVLHDGK